MLIENIVFWLASFEKPAVDDVPIVANRVVLGDRRQVEHRFELSAHGLLENLLMLGQAQELGFALAPFIPHGVPRWVEHIGGS